MPTDLKPSAATNASTLDGTEKIPCSQGGNSRALTPAQIRTLIETLLSVLNVDNLHFDGNTISSTDANGNIILTPNGSGTVSMAVATLTNQLQVWSGPNLKVQCGSIGPNLAGDAAYRWSNGADAGGVGDTSLLRGGGATILAGDGGAGMGYVLAGRVVEASTAGSGAPNLLLAIESRKLVTNEGATAEAYNTLPSAAAGMEFRFVCQDGDGIRIVADAGDTIRSGTTVSVAAGFIRSSTVGSSLTLVAINATEWVVTSITGTWMVDV